MEGLMQKVSPEEEKRIYNKFKELIKRDIPHLDDKSSTPTLNKLNKMTDEITQIKIKMTKQEGNIEHIKEGVNSLKADFKEFVKSANDKYANKEQVKDSLELEVKTREKLEKTVSKVFWIAFFAVLGFLGFIIRDLVSKLLSL